jgi:undecaprenyl diphosphate synthase
MKDLLATLSPGEPDWDLATSIDPLRLPRHIAIIMDGNGRWAHRKSLPRIAGHRAGVGPVRMTVETCARLGIETLTLYAFSVENWKRPLHEVEALWRLLRIYLRKELPKLMRNRIRLNPIGRPDGLPAKVRAELEAAALETSGNGGLCVNLAINYGGRAELVDAVNAILDEARREGGLSKLEVDEETIAAHLYTAGQDDPDLLVRTSGELRISNFLLWQVAYAEIYVTETFWPDFSRTDLLRAIVEYQKRDRRFGGLTPAAPRPKPQAEEVLGAPTR